MTLFKSFTLLMLAGAAMLMLLALMAPFLRAAVMELEIQEPAPVGPLSLQDLRQGAEAAEDPYADLLRDLDDTLASTAPATPPMAPPTTGGVPLTKEQLAELPLTSHARAGAAGRNWNAEQIRQQILADKCSPIEVYLCVDSILVTCGDHQGTELGLVIGTLTPAHPIVTGYPSNRWINKIGQCIGPYPLP